MAMLSRLYKNYNHCGYLNKLLQRCKKKVEKKLKEEAVCWNQLPGDILLEIVHKLNLPDRLRMSVVCKSWGLAVSVYRQNKNKIYGCQVPWLMLPYDRKNNSLRFFDLCENQLYNIKLPKTVQGAWCFGSCKGWLGMMKGPETNPKLFLFNPISGVQLPLPPLTTVPCFQTFVFCLEDPLNIADFIDTIELSSADASSFTVGATFYGGKILAVCRPEDESWTIFQGIDYEEPGSYLDILFCNGILHALMGGQNTDFAEHSLRVRDDNIILKLITVAGREEIDWIPEGEKEVVWTSRAEVVRPYMVECKGELLLVQKITDLICTEKIPDDYDEHEDHDDANSNDDYDEDDDEYTDDDEYGGEHTDGEYADENEDDGGYSDNNEDDGGEYSSDDDYYDDDDDDRDVFTHSETRRFEVFKIGYPSSTLISETKLNSLQNQILFVADTGSVSVEGRDFNGLKENCIIFLDDINHVISDCDPPVSRESGIFHFEDGRIDRCFPIINNSIHCHMIWFSPNIP